MSTQVSLTAKLGLLSTVSCSSPQGSGKECRSSGCRTGVGREWGRLLLLPSPAAAPFCPFHPESEALLRYHPWENSPALWTRSEKDGERPPGAIADAPTLLGAD